MMGAGKSTVARLVAERIGCAAIDTDEMVEQRAGMSVAQMFAGKGEETFRAAESEAVAELGNILGPLVVSVGGGAVIKEENRRAMRLVGTVVWLRARPATLSSRVGLGQARPLLAQGDGGELQRLERLEHLDAGRRDLYDQVADVVIDVDELSPEQVAELVLASACSGASQDKVGSAQLLASVAAMRRVTVDLGERSYPVVVGRGARHALSSLLPVGAKRAAIVTQSAIGVEVDVGTGVEQRTFVIGAGEAAKSMSTVEELCRGFVGFGLTRADVVVGVGGGVVTDVAGFAASVYHRGVPVAHVATTLLGQVDAAIGGKTGVNLAEGKNLVGSFWQPVAVICDTDVLATLPPREYRSGLGEMAKYAFLGVEDLAELDLDEAVARCVACKARWVSGDERETESLRATGAGETGGGGRALLNYGHTLAHALETVGHYDLRHGEAVAVGLVFAARLARRLGRIGDERVALHEQVVAAYDLPSALPSGVDIGGLLGAMGRDKKATGNGLTFVLDGPRGLEVVRSVPEEAVLATLSELREPG